MKDSETAATCAPAPAVYSDPPYTVSHNNNGLIRYNERIFSWSDQQRLAATATLLVERGRIAVASNAFHQAVRELYREGVFKLSRVRRVTTLAARADQRGSVSELLVASRSARLKCLPHFAVRMA